MPYFVKLGSLQERGKRCKERKLQGRDAIQWMGRYVVEGEEGGKWLGEREDVVEGRKDVKGED